MIKEVTIFNKFNTSIEYELLRFAFTTPKGSYTLSASYSDGTDDWRNMSTKEYHNWHRKKISDWFKSGKIEPIEESKTIIWHLK